MSSSKLVVVAVTESDMTSTVTSVMTERKTGKETSDNESRSSLSDDKKNSLASELDPWDLVDEDDNIVKWAGSLSRYEIQQFVTVNHKVLQSLSKCRDIIHQILFVGNRYCQMNKFQ